ncbi:MAG TPA: DNA primase [Thiothrix sp.]|nr:DNA primase [Thiothrix sp.]
MSGLIPRSFIDDLLTRVDIVDTIHARVSLKKKGQLYAACCPFHNEKTPSFMVNPIKQFYYCFGCGVSGTAISFMMAYEHLDFVEAVESLAANQGLSVPREKGKRAKAAAQAKQKNKSLYTLMEDVAHYYQQNLQKNSAAQAYLEQRGLSREVIDRYSLGYIPEGWDAVSKRFSQQSVQNTTQSYTQQQLLDVGLLIKNEKGRVYDRFRDRIMFPIVDRRGRTIGFGGRVMGDGSPKYLNSPETTLFHKGTELYGFYEARQHTRKLSRIVVVEGYMDVIALAQFGISYAVATLGTATTKEHVGHLFRAVSEVIFCFDGDRAGREAAWRALQNSLTVLRDGKDIRFLFLPMGEDPDSQVRKIGREAFEKSLQRDSISMTDYLIEHLSKSHNLSSREGRASFLAEAGQLLQTMPDGLICDQLKVDVARLTSIDLAAFTKRKRKQINAEPKQSFSRLNDRKVRITPIRYAITLLLHRPALAAEVSNLEEIVMFNLPGVILLAKLIETIEESPHINAAAILDRWRDTQHEASIVSLMRWQPKSDDDVMLAREIKDCLRQIRKQAYGKKLENLLQKERINGLDDLEKRDLLALLRECDHPERIEQ